MNYIMGSPVSKHPEHNHKFYNLKSYFSGFLTSICLIALVLLLPFSVKANSKDFEVKIAIVDVQTIWENSLAMQDIRKSIDKISGTIEKEMSAKEQDLKKIEDDIIKKRGTIDEIDFANEVSIFNNKVNDVHRDMQDKKSRLEQAHSKAVAVVHNTTIEIITELSNVKGFNMVLPSSQIVYAHSSLDITEAVIERLNNRLKTVQVSF